MSRASSWVMVNFYLYLQNAPLRKTWIHTPPASLLHDTSLKTNVDPKKHDFEKEFPFNYGDFGCHFWFWGNRNWSTKGHLFEELLWTCTKNPSTSIFMKDAPGKDEWIKGLRLLLLNFKHFGEAHLGLPMCVFTPVHHSPMVRETCDRNSFKRREVKSFGQLPGSVVFLLGGGATVWMYKTL